MMRNVCPALVGAVLTAGCAADAMDAIEGCDDCDIFGDDNRVEAYELDLDTIRQASRAIGALIPRSSLSEDGSLEIRGETYGERRDLCPDVRFADQPAMAGCSGFLITDELFVTAGHCTDYFQCSELSIAFDYAYLEEGALLRAVAPGNIYHCAETLFEVWNDDDDFALIRLDRPVADRAPLTIAGDPTPGTAVYTLGFPNGIPLKAATTTTQASYLTPAWDRVLEDPEFVAANGSYSAEDQQQAELEAASLDIIPIDADVFGGNSGGALIDAKSGAAYGVVIWAGRKYRDGYVGGKDLSYEEDPTEGCLRPTTCGVEVECITYPAAARIGRYRDVLPPGLVPIPGEKRPKLSQTYRPDEPPILEWY